MGLSYLKLTELQEDIASELKADAWFEQVPVVTERYGEVESITELAVAKLGLVVAVHPPRCTMSNGNIPDIHFDRIEIDVSVFENVPINRRRAGYKMCLETAQVALALLNQCQPRNCGLLTPATPTLEVRIGQPRPNVSAVILHFITNGGYVYEPESATTPTETFEILTEAGVPIYTEADEPILGE